MTRALSVLMLLPASTTAAIAAAPHSGIVKRNGFALSDIALFVVAVIGVWTARRALRARFRKRSDTQQD